MSTELSGSEGLFEEQLTGAMPCLEGLAMSLCRNRCHADDLMQETLTSAWRARESFLPGTRFKAWACTIMRNQFRSEKRSGWYRYSAPLDASFAEQKMSIDDEQFSIAVFHDALRMMDRLPASQQHALMMIGAEGLSYGEAAKIEGCPTGTLKSRVSRARRALKDMIENGTGSTEQVPNLPVTAIARPGLGQQPFEGRAQA